MTEDQGTYVTEKVNDNFEVVMNKDFSSRVSDVRPVHHDKTALL